MGTTLPVGVHRRTSHHGRPLHVPDGLRGTGIPPAVPRPPRWLVVAGLGLTLVVAIIPLLAGEPLLRSASTVLRLGGQELHLVSATVFDIGVLVVVVGVAVGMITRLGEELGP